MNNENMVMTKSKNNATRAKTVAFVTRSSRKFAGNRKGGSVGTTTNRAGKVSRADQEHQSNNGRDRKSTIMSNDKG